MDINQIKLKSHESELKQMLIQANESHEIQLKQLSAIIHKNIGGKLGALSIWISNLLDNNDQDSRVIVDNLISDLSKTARNISHHLYPATLDGFGLISAIEDFVNEIEHGNQIQVYITQECEKKTSSKSIKIFRIVAQCLSASIGVEDTCKVRVLLRETEQTKSIVLIFNDKLADMFNQEWVRHVNNQLMIFDVGNKWKESINSMSRLIISTKK